MLVFNGVTLWFYPECDGTQEIYYLRWQFSLYNKKENFGEKHRRNLDVTDLKTWKTDQEGIQWLKQSTGLKTPRW